MKNLLVPTDFSPESHHAFEVALRIAQRAGGSVTLLHVVELPEGVNISTFGGPVGGDMSNSGGDGMERLFVIKLLEATKRRMHNLMAEGRRIAEGVPVRDVVSSDRIGPAILKTIEDHRIDLVVMGAQGHTAMEHFFMGSNTERMVRMAPCPVLAVKHQHKDFEVRKIVFPSDFSEEVDRTAPTLQKIQELFPDAKLHLLHVTHSSDPKASTSSLERMRAFAQRHNLRNVSLDLFTDANERTGIQHFSRETNADMIVLPTHGRTGVNRYLHASIAENVATHAYPPVLTFRF